MAKLDCEAPVVAEENRLTGMVTGRDMGVRVAAEGCDPKEVTVGEAMTAHALYCFEDEPVQAVAEKMAEWWVRRLPVVNGQAPDRRVSLADVISPKTAPRPTEWTPQPRKFRRSRSVWQTGRVGEATVAA